MSSNFVYDTLTPKILADLSFLKSNLQSFSPELNETEGFLFSFPACHGPAPQNSLWPLTGAVVGPTLLCFFSFRNRNSALPDLQMFENWYFIYLDQFSSCLKQEGKSRACYCIMTECGNLPPSFLQVIFIKYTVLVVTFFSF